MQFYLIKHKPTGKIMPLMKRGRGYSHWNPSRNLEPLSGETEFPRLIKDAKSAKRIAQSWFRDQNLYADFKYPNDGQIASREIDDRKLEDLEYFPVDMIIDDPLGVYVGEVEWVKVEIKSCSV